ncbi:hypothetical protein EZJ43_00480 [Pedobacter changchengzhani]|uniref:Uncharacterized protein n=1 Tax=Pedobacter changchengzhani TaxID=2529274 RepID=A0A4R5MP55_9SPHI|nr:hypothetical protein [Pedobacter changchengzhani]TDG37607.1 hypothetical protein EZJ43_00480 [Pedobacter changchengzhani]
MTIISSKTHAVLDYLMVMVFLISPEVFNLGESASIICYALGGIHFLLTIMTDFSGGIFKIIKLKLHGLIELIVGVALILLAFIFFNKNAVEEIYFACVGLLILFIYMITDYKKLPPIITR